MEVVVMLQMQDVQAVLKRADAHTLSLYLTIDPSLPENQAANPGWRTWAKNRLRDIDHQVSAGEDLLWPGLRQRAERFLEDYIPAARGLALLLGESLEEVYELPVAFPNRAAYGPPLITPLLWALDEYETYLVAMVDRSEARFFTTRLGQVQFEDSMELTFDTRAWRVKTAMPSGVGIGRGSAVDEFQDRKVEHQNSLYRDVAVQIAELMTAQGARRLVLTGSEQSIHAVLNRLPEAAAQAVVALLPIPMRHTTHEVMNAILPAALDYERRQESQLVEEMIGLAKAGGRAALGRVAVLQALERGQVEKLVMPWPVEQTAEDTDVPLRVLLNGGTVELVHGAAAERVKAEGGLIAQLYYALHQ
jgi:hypothetical protein